MKSKIIDTFKSLWRKNMGKRSFLICATMVSATLLILLVSRTPQGLYSDPATQMKALQQYLAGESPSINHVVMPKEGDLSEDAAGWISWWPPGTQLFNYPLMAGGVALGDALRIQVIVCLFLGSIGWVFWFSMFRFPWWIKIALAVALPWMRYTSNCLFLYITEILNYASAPWILLATYGLGELWIRGRLGLLRMALLFAFFGFCAGSVYVFKYSIIFVSIGSLVYLGITMFRRKSYGFLQTMACLVLALIFFIMPIAGLQVLNCKFNTGITPATTALGLNLCWQNLLFTIANPVLAMADGYSLLCYIFLHPVHGLLRNPLWPALIGLPGGLLLILLILSPSINATGLDSRRDPHLKILRDYELLAICVFLVSCACLFTLWSLSDNVSYEARHLAPAGIAILPLAVQKGYFFWAASRRGAVRAVLTGAAIAYIAVPLLYGGASVVGKVIRTPSDYKVGPSHIYNPLLADFDLAGVREKLITDFSSEKGIWYLPSYVTALSFSGRAIITSADFEDLDALKKRRYLSSSPLSVWALLPPEFEKNGKGDIIRNTFVQSDKWERKEIQGCKYFLWTTRLKGLTKWLKPINTE
ncbi:MAG: hypothetical protein A2Z72_05830 [Omnitrophica bacterium RBG_13_46_9]|nr:MAG: hypothetical protein A2Z72_05830 [Omnitrophica bacterium RBG_13_46_9]